MRRLFFLSILAARLFAADDFDWQLPAGFPRPQVPANNPMSVAKVELGRYLFYDTRISSNGKQSCASCHKQELAFTDGLPRAQGTTGELHPRSSMSLVNVAYEPVLTWANPLLTSLEAQAVVPMLGTAPIELGLKGHDNEFLLLVQRDPVYQNLFPLAFPGEKSPYTLVNVIKSIAAFERSIVSLRAPYDRYRWGGEPGAISTAAKRGEIIFESQRGRCFQCHGGWNFSGPLTPQFFNTGVGNYEAPNRGLFEITQVPSDIGRFRPPTLRNIAVTAPYMHDGSMPTLGDVLNHYSAGGRVNHPNKSSRIEALNLTETEKADVIEFLKSLTDNEMLHDARWANPWPQMKR